MTEIPATYGRVALSDPSSLTRVFEAADCRTQVELAKFLGIKQSSISDAKMRGSIPAVWLLTLLRKKWINPRGAGVGSHRARCANVAAVRPDGAVG